MRQPSYSCAEPLMEDFLLFAAVGFLAQAVDGALGMAYGVISSTVLLAFGVPPAQASASAHAAELFTTAASGSAHLYHRNIDWELFWRLIPLVSAAVCSALSYSPRLTEIWSSHSLQPISPLLGAGCYIGRFIVSPPTP